MTHEAAGRVQGAEARAHGGGVEKGGILLPGPKQRPKRMNRRSDYIFPVQAQAKSMRLRSQLLPCRCCNR